MAKPSMSAKKAVRSTLDGTLFVLSLPLTSAPFCHTPCRCILPLFPSHSSRAPPLFHDGSRSALSRAYSCSSFPRLKPFLLSNKGLAALFQKSIVSKASWRDGNGIVTTNCYSSCDGGGCSGVGCTSRCQRHG
jgi:hypothetical protein